jgi:hypothetical protein
MAYGKTTQSFPDLDDVTKYVFHNYFHLLTEDEMLAWKTCLAGAAGEVSSEFAGKFGLRRSKTILTLISEDPEKFLKTTCNRLLKEHKDKIVLNYCPRCGALARTPKAKICPKCSFNWHSKLPEAVSKN